MYASLGGSHLGANHPADRTAIDHAFDYARPMSAAPHPPRRSTASRAAAPSAAAWTSPDRVRHVWVAPSARQVDLRPYPGLLVDWQQRDDAWWGYVVMLLPTGALVANWVPSSLLRPVAPPSRQDTGGH
jgi:hypothetical protein